MGKKIVFKALLLTAKKTATEFEVPDEIIKQLGAGRRASVKVTINGYTYRSSVGVMEGVSMIGVSAEVREKAGVKGGDLITVTLEPDSEVWEAEVPDDFRTVLEEYPEAKAFFEGLSYSNKRRYVEPLGQTKNEETRARRMAKAIADLRAGKK